MSRTGKLLWESALLCSTKMKNHTGLYLMKCPPLFSCCWYRHGTEAAGASDSATPSCKILWIWRLWCVLSLREIVFIWDDNKDFFLASDCNHWTFKLYSSVGRNGRGKTSVQQNRKDPQLDRVSFSETQDDFDWNIKWEITELWAVSTGPARGHRAPTPSLWSLNLTVW